MAGTTPHGKTADAPYSKIVPPFGQRPPSPARAAATNTNTVVAGEGRGWGNNKLPCHETPSTLPPSKTQFGRKLGEHVAQARRTCGVSHMVEA